jgi:ATP phosphoribosyltransferase regulatory subunit
MSAETALKFEALERQAQTVMGVFAKAGHDIVAPSIIQPADVFLDCIGEAVRSRTYVFTDPDGAELCLRPDLTVPTCRLHIARHTDPATPAKYAYNGPAFRFQPQGLDATHPREFRQAGIERFGDKDVHQAEVTVIAVIIDALQAAGLKDWSLRLGDLGLCAAVLEAAHLPPRWQKRLAEAFWKPDVFRDELKRLKADPGANAKRVPADLAKALNPRDLEQSTAAVGDYLERNGIEAVGTRTVREMAEHLRDMTADRAAPPLDAATAKLIESYVAVSGPARNAGAKIAGLLKVTKSGAGAVLSAYDRRLALLANAGIDLDRVSFSAEFGRNLEYYTGLVFEVTAPALSPESPIAGGGRYDRLMRAAGAKADVPAVGGAIHTERLLHVVSGGRV